jgi:hypothetical protein
VTRPLIGRVIRARCARTFVARHCGHQVRRLAIALAAALVVVPAAAAKDGLQFTRATAHVGDPLVVATGYATHRSGVVVFFMPLRVAPRWWKAPYNGGWETPNNGPPPHVRGVIRLGAARPYGAHGLRLMTRVPRVTPGRYVLGIWCKPCNEHFTTALPNFQPSPTGILRVLG